MSLHNFYSKLSRAHLPTSGQGKYVPGLGYLEGWGTTVPSGTATGWGKSALFLHTDLTNSLDALYQNMGDATAADFKAITSEPYIPDDVDLGSSGSAGTLDIFPSTALKGKVQFAAADSAGNTTTQIVNASQAAARVYTIPDAGASASFVMTAGAQTITGVKAFNDGITVGSATTGIDFGGTYTGNAIDFSNTTIAPTGSNGPCLIRAGTYASPVDLGADEDQSGMIRLYSTTSADGTSYDRGLFVCTKTTGSKGAFPVAGLAEANNTTGNGPTKLQAAQFIAHLGADGSASKMASLGGDATAGMYGAWLKVTAGSNCTASSGSRVAPAWIDNQMSGTVSGEEYGIFATTGASRPDAFIGFETTSSGYDQLFYFDETYNSGAGTCVTTDAVPGSNQDARIKVYYNGTQYYLPLYR